MCPAFMLLATALLAAGAPSCALSAASGISRALAQSRATRLTDLHYQCAFARRPANSGNHADFTAPYLPCVLSELPDVKLHRKFFFLGAWLDAFIDGQNTLHNSLAAQAAVRAWLARGRIEPDLRLKVLKVSDALDRTVLLGQRFPR